MLGALATDDVRTLIRLVGELRELGADPAAWRIHLARSLESICRGHIVVVSELKPGAASSETTSCAAAVKALHLVDHGIDPSNRNRFLRDLYWTDHTTDDALDGIVPHYGTAFSLVRSEVVDDRTWNRSTTANERWRPLGCDDFVVSMAPVACLGVISSIEIYRKTGAPRFSDRERLIVGLLHEELSRDWNRPSTPELERLTPRQREVLVRLVAGASEKEIADELGVSMHTAHDHVKAIHRALRARSRGELLAKVSPLLRAPRARLVAEAL